MTGAGRGTRGTGTDRVALRVADLAGRLTDRDRQLCRLLLEHRVLTSHQLTQLAFNHLDTAEDRLRTLTRLGVLDRFRPRRDTGSAPYHYVLGPLGAATLAAEQHVTVAELGYRRATTLAIAHSRRLSEIVAVNSFFTALTGHARHHPDTELARWLSQRRCHDIWGRLVRPHGFGRWRDHDTALEFFLAYPPRGAHSATSSPPSPATTTSPRPPPSWPPTSWSWLPSTRRETELHRAVPPRHYLLATATPPPDSNPADAIWLPLGSTGPRRRLADLPHPHRRAPDRP